MAPFQQGSCIVYLFTIYQYGEKDFLVIPILQVEKQVKKDRLRPCPKLAKAGSMLHSIHQLYLKININQSSFWHCPTGKVMDGVFDVSFNCVGSLRHSYSESGVMPGIKHISGLLSHFLGYLFIFRVFNKKISREEKKEEAVGRNQESAI